jgi:hypothetical protein
LPFAEIFAFDPIEAVFVLVSVTVVCETPIATAPASAAPEALVVMFGDEVEVSIDAVTTLLM